MIRDVAFSCDDTGAKFLCVTVWSLLKHYKGKNPLRINVFEGFGGHSDESKAKLKAIVDAFNRERKEVERIGRQRNENSHCPPPPDFYFLRYHTVEKAVEPYKDVIMNRKNSRWNIFTWMPIFTPQVLADAEGNVAHFDIDMLFNDDVSKLLDLDLGENLIAAVAEYGKGDPVITEAVWGKGILPPEAERYFNTGTIVFNMAKCREEKTWEKIVAWYRDHYAIADRIEQDAWNALYWKRTKLLPLRWNFHDRLIKFYPKWNLQAKYWQGNPPQECLEAALNPAILHFWGPKKPWKPSHRPYRKLYHEAMCAVGQVPPEEPALTCFYDFVRDWKLCKISRRWMWTEKPLARRSEGICDVFYSCDDLGVRYLLVSILSLLKFYRGAAALRVNILEGFGGLSAESHALLESVVNRFPFAQLRFVDMAPVVEPVQDLLRPRAGSRWNAFAWMPIFGPDLLKDVEGNLLYLDIDTLVNTDVTPLFELDLKNDLVAAVYENHYRPGKNDSNYEWREGLLPREAERYFNDGVLVFNTARYRDEKCLEALLSWYRQHAEKAYRIEQDALNGVFWNRTRPLHPKWNYHDRTVRKYSLMSRKRYWDGNVPQECLEAALNPAILHFWGRKKPWNPSHRPYRHLYHAIMRELEQEVPPEQRLVFLNNLINRISFALLSFRWARGHLISFERREP